MGLSTHALHLIIFRTTKTKLLFWSAYFVQVLCYWNSPVVANVLQYLFWAFNISFGLQNFLKWNTSPTLLGMIALVLQSQAFWTKKHTNKLKPPATPH